jgi:hypothetical protein
LFVVSNLFAFLHFYFYGSTFTFKIQRTFLLTHTRPGSLVPMPEIMCINIINVLFFHAACSFLVSSVTMTMTAAS